MKLKLGSRQVEFDDCDSQLVAQYSWYADGRCADRKYAKTRIIQNGKRVGIVMHRLILGLTDPKVLVDHINGNSLDNRRCNLRVCSSAENAMNRKISARNSTGVKGVTIGAGGKKPYRAKIMRNGIHYRGPCRETIEEAYEDYKRLAKQHHGEFARLA